MGWTVSGAQHVRLSDLRDKVVVLDFYATWCEPCRDSIPHLVGLHSRLASQGLTIVGLNVGGPGDYDKVPAFARKFNIQYQLGIPDNEVEDLYLRDDSAIPQTFVLDRQGQVLKRFVGYDEFVGAELDQVVSAALSTK